MTSSTTPFRGRWIAAAVLLCGLFSGAPVPAQEPDPAAFLIETITVEGVSRDSVREIVAAESRLRPGQTYSEQELREAVYRVRRLPFVLDAEFSLRKGSKRGAYELVIAVEQTRPLFYSLDGQGVVFRDDDEDPFSDSSGFEAQAQGTAGARHFVGSRGLAFASVNLGEELGRALEVGYTQYNLFGPGSFASVGLFSRLDDPDPGDSDEMQGALTVGIPIAGSHSLRSTLTLSRSEYDFSYESGEGQVANSSRYDSRDLDVEWIYDTTDDPLFPTTGLKVVGGAGYAVTEQKSRATGPFPVSFEETFRQAGVSFAAERHWSLTPRQSLSLGLDSAFQSTDPGKEDKGFTGSDFSSSIAFFGHSWSLWGAEKTGRVGDLRLENRLTLYHFHQEATGLSLTDTAAALGSSIVFRNRWGLIRAGLTFITEDGL